MEQTDTTKKALSNRYVGSFLVIAFLFSWSFWLVSGILSRHGQTALDFHWLIAQIGVFGPSLTAILVSAIFQKKVRNNALRVLPLLIFPLVLPGILIASSAPVGVVEFSPLVSVTTVVVSIAVIWFFSSSNRSLYSPGNGTLYGRLGAKWGLLSITFFPALFLLAWLLANLQGRQWTILTLQNNVVGFVWLLPVSFAHNLLLGGSLGEEIGWRGFLLTQLLKRNNPLAASLIVGVVWALWHLPIDLNAGNFPEVSAAVIFRIISALSFSILFTWFFLHKNNLLVPLFIHTSINMLPDLGFSQYDISMILFVTFCAIAALIIATFSRVFRRSHP